MVNPTDAELVRQTLNGDRRSFDALVDRYRHQVFRLAYFKVRRAEEAEDMAQDAFVAAYQSLAQLREHDRFAPWLRRVAENVCNMSLRRNRIETVPLEDYQAHADDISGEIENRMLHSQVHEALSKLSETNRLTAMLFFADGLSQQEIAEFLDVPLTTVKRRINLSRTQLKKEMIDMVKDDKPKPDFTAKVAAKIDVMRWYQALSDYIDAGTSLARTLDELAQRDFTDKIRKETLAIKSAVMQDKTLSAAIAAEAPTLNHPLAVAFIRTGEIGGILEKSTRALVAWSEREDMSLKVDAAYWLRLLASLLTAGVPVTQAIETMEPIKFSPLTQVTAMLKEGVTKGVWFSEVMAQFPDVFSPAAVALVCAGEKARMLEDGMVRAASEILRETYEKIRTDPGLAVSDEGKEKFIEQLRTQLSDESADVRLGALQALNQLAGADSIKDYVKVLSDANPRIRCVAAQILSKYPSAVAVSPLEKALKDTSVEVRSAVLKTLVVCDPAKGFEAAKSALTDTEVEVRRAGVKALALSGVPEAAVLLKELASDYDTLVAKDAQDALANLPE